MMNISNPPLVNTIGYGDYENLLSSAYLNRLNVEFQKFGVMGCSVLACTGWFGVGCDGYVPSLKLDFISLPVRTLCPTLSSHKSLCDLCWRLQLLVFI